MNPSILRSTLADVPELHRIRLAVRENRLSDPTRLTEADYAPFINGRGETWHAVVEGKIAGFGALDQGEQSIWALFVDPVFEGIGLGKMLLAKLIDQARAAEMQHLWLVTTTGTRAEAFYLRSGWKAAGLTDDGECRLVLHLDQAPADAV